MRAAPWWAVLSAASCLVTLLVICRVSRVQSLPCSRDVAGAGVQLAKIVCFITASSEHYDYESLRTGMCSHIVLIDLMGVGKDGCLELLQASSRSLNRFNRMKRRFRDVGDQASFIISIGGVAQKSSHFSKALKTTESSQALLDELLSFNIKHGLDGIDISWFYPAQFGGVESDRTTLVVFLRDLYLRTKACGMSLSLTVGVDPKDIELSYDVPRINEVVDFVNLLTGDYHNPTSPTHISPLFGQGPRDRLNINYSVMSYIEAGLNPRKIVILNSCYAYLYVSKINKEDTICPAKLRTVARLSFLSAREIIIRESFQTSWDDMRHVPYGVITRGITKKWITYNDVESVKRKADYVLHYQLGGMGLFSVDEDDYGGRSGCGRYPMLRTIVATLHPELICKEPESDGDVETIVCPYDGFLADPVLPEYYYDCKKGVDLQDCPKQRCPQGGIFDEGQHSCYQPARQEHTTTASYDDLVSQYSTIGPLAHAPTVPPNSLTVSEAPSVPTDSHLSEPCSHREISPYEVSVDNPSNPANAPDFPGVNNGDLPNGLLALPSTMAPSYCEPIQQLSSTVPQVLITTHSFDDPIEQASNIQVRLLAAPRPSPAVLKSTTDATVLITPKVNYNRTTKKPSKGRRKSRSRSHSGRTSTEKIATETTSSVSTTQAVSHGTSTKSTPNSIRSRARRTKTNATTIATTATTATSIPTSTTTTATTTIPTTTIPTTIILTTTIPTTTTVKTTTTIATTTPCATSTVSDNTTLPSNETNADKTQTTVSQSTSAPTTVSSRLVTTTTATTATTTVSTLWNDGTSQLVTTVT